MFWDPTLTPSSFHGVTTVVAGNCGFSIAPTRPEHLDLIARTLENVEDMDVAALAAGVPWDFASFPEYLAAVGAPGPGSTTPPTSATPRCGSTSWATTPTSAPPPPTRSSDGTELREALDAGAAGFATSLAPTHRGAEGKPVPSRLADRAELEALFARRGGAGRGVVEVTPGRHARRRHLRPPVAAGVPFTMTALLSMPTGSHRRMVDLNRAGLAAAPASSRR